MIQDERKYYIVMTRCSGGELFDFLQTETDVPERECKRIMREILEAVDHIHSRCSRRLMGVTFDRLRFKSYSRHI